MSPALVSPPEVSTAVVAPSETQRVVGASAGAKSAVAAPSRPTRASIAQETALLAEAQRALKAGSALLALEALDPYAKQCPAGLLHEEATVSQVLALCAVGREQDARRWAHEFLRRYLTSPLLPRVRNDCATANVQAMPGIRANVDCRGPSRAP